MKELSDQEVLQAAVEKAIDGGWNWNKTGRKRKLIRVRPYPLLNAPVAIDFDELGLVDDEGVPARMVTALNLHETIFSHEFCKALFGDEIVPYPGLPKKYSMIAWQYHLQQLAIAEDRIDYLRRNT